VIPDVQSGRSALHGKKPVYRLFLLVDQRRRLGNMIPPHPVEIVAPQGLLPLEVLPVNFG
jgi:hypothetical protein